MRGDDVKQCSSRSFPIIWGWRNSSGFLCSILSCPLHPPPSASNFPYLYYSSISPWLSVFLSTGFLVLVHLPFFLADVIFFLTCPIHIHPQDPYTILSGPFVVAHISAPVLSPKQILYPIRSGCRVIQIGFSISQLPCA